MLIHIIGFLRSQVHGVGHLLITLLWLILFDCPKSLQLKIPFKGYYLEVIVAMHFGCCKLLMYWCAANLGQSISVGVNTYIQFVDYVAGWMLIIMWLHFAFCLIGGIKQ